MILWLWACAGPTGGDADTGTDTDTDASSDSIPPEPTGDTGEAPCPFAGAWDLVLIDSGDAVPFEEGPTAANMTGTASRCEWDLVVVRGGCRQRELAVLLAEPFGAWTAWSDGAPDTTPEGCGSITEPYESRAYPALSEDGVTMTLSYGSAIFHQQGVTYHLRRR